jgi:putative oxidoreductase
MSNVERMARDAAPHLLSLLRIMAALLLLQHGTQKLLGFPPGRAAPELLSLYWFAGMIELVGGVLLALGLFSRTTAFILSGELAFAYWMGHAPRGGEIKEHEGVQRGEFAPVEDREEAAGPGPWSVDRMISGRRTD